MSAAQYVLIPDKWVVKMVSFFRYTMVSKVLFHPCFAFHQAMEFLLSQGLLYPLRKIVSSNLFTVPKDVVMPSWI